MLTELLIIAAVLLIVGFVVGVAVATLRPDDSDDKPSDKLWPGM